MFLYYFRKIYRYARAFEFVFSLNKDSWFEEKFCKGH